MNSNSSNRPSILKWVLLITCGWVIGFITGLFIADELETLHLDFILISIGISFGVGLMQRIALRKQFFINNLWVTLEIAGLSIPFVIADFVVFLLNNRFPGLISENTNMLLIAVATSLGGALAGWLQYKIILNKDDSPSNRKWIKYSFIGWMGCSCFIVTYFLITANLHLEKIMAGKLLNTAIVFLGGPILGGLSGLGLKSICNTSEFKNSSTIRVTNPRK